MDTLKAWSEICKLHKPEKSWEYLSSPLWYNNHISEEPLYFLDWYRKGIVYVGDVLDTNGQVMDQDTIINKYGVKKLNFLDYGRIKILCKKFLKKCKFQLNLPYLNQKPQIPFHYTILNKSTKGTKDIHKIFKQSTNEVFSAPKWETDLQISIEEENWIDIYNACFKIVQDNYLIWHQYKIIKRILGTRDYLTKINITDDPLCSFCKTSREKWYHLFYECNIIRDLWRNLQNWILNTLRFNVPLDKFTVTMGYLIKDGNYFPLNTIFYVQKPIYSGAQGLKKYHIY